MHSGSWSSCPIQPIIRENVAGRYPDLEFVSIFWEKHEYITSIYYNIYLYIYLFLFIYLFKCIHIHTYIHSFLCFGGPTRHYKTYGHAKVCVHVHTFFPWMETSHCENPAKEETMGTMNLRLWCCHAPIPRPPNKSRGSDRQRKVAVPHLKGPSRRPLIFPSSKSNYYDYTVTIFPQIFPYYHGW